VSSQPIVIGVYGDAVRAEQAVRALEVWRKANRGLGVGPIGVVGRGVSGTTTWRSWGVIRTGRAVLRGLVAGLFLFGLPAAGAAALAAWAVGSLAFGLAGLVGAVPASSVGGLVLAVMVGAALILGVLVGLVGAAIGCLIGLLVGVIDGQVRGLTRAEVVSTATSLSPGAWATVARVQADAEPLVRDEMARLGASEVVDRSSLPASPPIEDSPTPLPEGTEAALPEGSAAAPQAEGAAPTAPAPEQPVPAGSRQS
jgi:hypothetical protein